MQTDNTTPITHQPDRSTIRRAIAKRSFATLATTSPAGRPHSAGVLYQLVDDVLYINTLRTSRKARNVVANPHVGLCVIVRRIPFGPPSTVQFQSTAEVLALDHPDVTRAVADGRLDALTGHGELDLPDGCFLRIALPRRAVTYGLGMPLRRLIADPLSAGGEVTLAPGTDRPGG